MEKDTTITLNEYVLNLHGYYFTNFYLYKLMLESLDKNSRHDRKWAKDTLDGKEIKESE